MNVVNLVFDGWRKESGKPPGSHPGPQGRMDSVERFEKYFDYFVPRKKRTFADFIDLTLYVRHLSDLSGFSDSYREAGNRSP